MAKVIKLQNLFSILRKAFKYDTPRRMYLQRAITAMRYEAHCLKSIMREIIFNTYQLIRSNVNISMSLPIG